MVKSMHQSQTLLHIPPDWLLLRLCPAPVLLRTSNHWQRKPVVLASLDLRVDDKPHTILNRKVLEPAHAFAELHGGELHCVCVVDVPKVLSELNVPDPRGFQQEGVVQARQRLAELAEPYGIPKKRLHVEGRPCGESKIELPASRSAGDGHHGPPRGRAGGAGQFGGEGSHAGAL